MQSTRHTGGAWKSASGTPPPVLPAPADPTAWPDRKPRVHLQHCPDRFRSTPAIEVGRRVNGDRAPLALLNSRSAAPRLCSWTSSIWPRDTWGGPPVQDPTATPSTRQYAPAGTQPRERPKPMHRSQNMTVRNAGMSSRITRIARANRLLIEINCLRQAVLGKAQVSNPPASQRQRMPRGLEFHGGDSPVQPHATAPDTRRPRR